MSKRILWLMVSGLMALSLVMAACGPAVTPTTPITPTTPAAPTTPTTSTTPSTPTTPAAPAEKEAVTPAPAVAKYGGILTLSQSGDILGFDSSMQTAGNAPSLVLTNQELWMGDWAKGPAGGYGTRKTDWGDDYDVFNLKTGYIAESVKWTVDEAKNQGTIIYQIRQGIRWALNPASEASRLVGGRGLTADDVISELKRAATNNRSYIYRSNVTLRNAEITKTGPWEVTVKVAIEGLIAGLSLFGDALYMHPPEVVAKYGDANSWRNSVGTGPYMLSDYIAGSVAILVRNPNYWMKDPVGPGKGNQLPYLDSVRLLIIPDASTRLAALRTGKVDQMSGLTWEDTAQLRKTTPALLEAPGTIMSGIAPIYINTTRKPFTDVRVRRAMLMATDLDRIRKTVNGGLGQILTTPYPLVTGYEALYLGLDDPEMPASVRELYTYNPEKAKRLLTEAGYPNGFKTTVLVASTDADYYSIIKDMWAKVGIDLKLDVRETAVLNNLRGPGVRDYDLSPGPHAPVSIYYSGSWFWGLDTSSNLPQVNDPYINKIMPEINRAIVIQGEAVAMGMMKELMKYVLDQAYAIPRPRYNLITMWWPWVKNYSGEYTIGYHNYTTWAQWVWLDQELKKSMGY